ncbi:hypothetical protein TevJSym_bi00040 [endosymbiont of Tevnia jerichonana (vent Tica)]|uniref:Uncharacterized protein n=1 Tax=endosymbiont of Tevnia jerichonana (vent Tica) TaxID=1049564 RepID=G2FIZ8_9GAMM|nr:hypothetical protein TevJSym_bi00040 [endosymbiont of Tevnia jerichonana (vent Tica)]
MIRMAASLAVRSLWDRLLPPVAFCPVVSTNPILNRLL